MPKGPHTVLFHAVPSARGDLPHKEVETFRMLALREHSETTVQVSPSPNPNPNPDPDQALCEWPVPFHLLPLVDIAQLLQHRGLDWGPKASALLAPLAAAVD